MRKKQFQSLIILNLFTLILLSCNKEKVPEPFYPKNNHEAYQKGLENANLLNTALGKDWQQSAQNAMYLPDEIELPYEEAFYIDEKQAEARGYRFKAVRGQKIQIALDEIAADSMELFIDLYRIQDSTYYHVASADTSQHLLGFEPRQDAEYVLRFQTELLRGGTFKITFESVPTLSFPVAGRTHRSIGSIWGDVRDGGKRSHEGVDIFAPRGTPVLAPTDGVIRRANERGIGGKVVWLSDSKRSQNLYFAHLNDWNVERGDQVKVGDTLGFVGNTGNARTTPPHLHFGIYSRGAINPINHLKPLGRQIRKVDSQLEWLGKELRLESNAKLYSDIENLVAINDLNKHQVLKVVSLNTRSCKVQLPNGQIGYVKKREIDEDLDPIENLKTESELTLMKHPNFNSYIGRVAPNDQLEVIGKNEEFLFVKTVDGQKGWINPNLEQYTAPLEEDSPKD